MSVPKYLTARFDVSELSEEEIGGLHLEVYAQAEPSDNHGGVTCEVHIEHGEQLRAQREQIERLERELREARDHSGWYGRPVDVATKRTCELHPTSCPTGCLQSQEVEGVGYSATPRHQPIRVQCISPIITADNDLIVRGTKGTIIGWKLDKNTVGVTCIVAKSPRRWRVLVAWDSYMYLDEYSEDKLGTESPPTPCTVRSPLHCDTEYDNIIVDQAAG